MADTMTKAEMVERLWGERANWEAALAAVGEARMTRPGVEGDWNVKDVVAHVAFYARWIGDQVEGALDGETAMRFRPDLPPETNTPDTHARNAVVYRLNKDRPLAEVLTEDTRAQERLMALVERLPEAAINDRQAYQWTLGYPLWRAIEGDSWGHLAEHTAHIRAWLERQPE